MFRPGTMTLGPSGWAFRDGRWVQYMSTNDDYARLSEYLDAGHLKAVRPYKLRGFGDAASVNAMLASTDTSFKALTTALAPFLNAFPNPLDIPTIQAIKTAVGNAGVGFYASIGDTTFAGLLRYFLTGAALNLNLAHALMNGPKADDATTQSQATALVTSSKNLIDAIGSLLQGAQSTESAIQSAIQTAGNVAQKITGVVGLNGLRLGALGLEPIEVGAAIIAFFIVAAVIAYCFTQYEAGVQAAAAADSACAQAAANGTPCSAQQWSDIHDSAARAAASLTLLPDLGRAVQNVGSLIFWGGLLAAGALVGYGIWTTYPAAATVRGRLQERARR